LFHFFSLKKTVEYGRERRRERGIWWGKKYEEKERYAHFPPLATVFGVE
jgi:hypothetical protein